MQMRPAKKLTVYVDETDKIKGIPLYEAVMEICYKNRAAGVSVFRGVAGYGRDRKFHTAKILELSASLPIKIEVIDTEKMINSILPEITGIITKGLVEISDTMIAENRDNNFI